MKTSVRLMGLVIFLSLVLMGGIVFATGGTSTVPTRPGTTVGTPTGTAPPSQGKCCIAGKYEGFHKDTPSKTCPKPGDGKFIMVINQDRECGSKIWGKVIDPKDGSTQDFEGIVTYDPEKKCCKIQGRMRRLAAAGAPAETTTFSGLLCKKDGKWAGKGTYTTTRPGVTCNGTWEMKQV